MYVVLIKRISFLKENLKVCSADQIQIGATLGYAMLTQQYSGNVTRLRPASYYKHTSITHERITPNTLDCDTLGSLVTVPCHICPSIGKIIVAAAKGVGDKVKSLKGGRIK